MATNTQLARQYATALSRMSALPRVDTDDLLKTFLVHLRKKGRLALLPSIVRNLKTISIRKTRTEPLLETASQEEREEAEHAAIKLGFIAPRVVINPSLIRGWRAHAGGTLIDHSAKRSLIELYQNITH